MMENYTMTINKAVACILSGISAMILVFAPASYAAHELTPHEQLGKSIFFDKKLSLKNNQSCATCHDPVTGWTGPDSEINAHGAAYKVSVEVRFGDRKPPSAAYAAFEASAEVNPFTSKFDYFLKGMAELTKEEKKGLDLFNKKGKCSKCHISDGFIADKK